MDAASSQQQRPWASWLMTAYIVTLIAFPVDFGLKVGGVVLTPSRLVLLVALVVATVEWRGNLTAARTLPLTIWLAWLCFLGSVFVTAATIPSSASWVRYASLVVEGVVVFLLAYRAALTPAGLRRLLTAVVATTVVVAAATLILAALGIHYDHVLAQVAGSQPAPQVADRLGLERQAGSFRAPLYFGIWMAVVSALLLPAMAEGRPRARQLAWAAWAVLLVSVAILTASRLATTAMFVLPGIYFVIRGKGRVGVAFLLLAAVVGVSFSILSLEPVISGDTENLLVQSSTMRVASIQAVFEALQMHPLFGWGLLSDVTVLSAFIGDRNYVDDVYLSLLVEVGIVGTFSFLLLVAAILARSRRAWRSAVGLALGIALLGLLTMGAFASTLKSTQSYAAFCVLAALGLATGALRSQAWNDEVFGSKTPAPVPERIADVPGQRREGQEKPVT